MGDRAADWRRRAAELRQSAGTARDAAVRQLLLMLAQEYDELTAAAEREERADEESA